MPKTVQDVRALYLHPGERAELVAESPGWNATKVTVSDFQVTASAGMFGGLLAFAGSSDLKVLVYDEVSAAAPNESAQVAVLSVPAGGYDGWVDFPVRIKSGLRIVLNGGGTDRSVFVYWR